MDSSKITYHGRPEPTDYDRGRHAKMRLRPIGYGYFHTNRSKVEIICEGCEQEITTPITRTHNGKPYHIECYKKL